MKVNPSTRRIELTGLWAGFGFSQGELWTPEWGSFKPADFAWPALQRNIVREWQACMANARGDRNEIAPSVLYMREVLAGARARVLATRDQPKPPTAIAVPARESGASPVNCRARNQL